jgi:prepilin-type N-terminal cleavage/methylation domain-containing protein
LKTTAVRRGGFTLVEVMIALAILGTTAVVLLDRRTEIVREAARSKERRALYVLASRKIGELELDKRLWALGGGSANGDFGEDDSDYAGFTWEAAVLRQPVDLSEPGRLPDPGKKPREIFRLSLLLRAPSLEDPILIEGQFPTEEKKEEPQPGQPPQPPPPPGGNP